MTARSELLAAVSALVIAGALSTGTAGAASLGAPVVPAWTGFYAGFGTAAAINKSTADFVWVPSTVDGTNDFSATNFAGSVDGGYDFQAGRMVFGATANFDFAFSHDTEIWGKDPDHHQRMTSDIGTQWGIGVRLGGLLTDTTLLYGAAGYAGASAHITAFDDAATAKAYDGNLTLSGYYLGAGIETIISNGWSLKTEYRVSKYSNGFMTPVFDDPDTAAINFHDFSSQTVKLSLDHRF
ncbi:MAG TPA: outer membrane beta-barrel protein [Bauldia sp.]|nr:outer membrane beta-barrel protein [Bauldia sp.]